MLGNRNEEYLLRKKLERTQETLNNMLREMNDNDIEESSLRQEIISYRKSSEKLSSYLHNN